MTAKRIRPRGRPAGLDVQRVARAARLLPEIMGRPPLAREIASLFGVSAPTAAKYLKLACDAGLLAGSPAPEPSPTP